MRDSLETTEIDSIGLSDRAVCASLRENLILAGFEIQDIDDGCMWIHQYFIPAQHATDLFTKLKNETQWKQPLIKMGARTIPSPRLAAWHGDPEAVYRYSGVTNQPSCWTPTLNRIRARLAESTGVQFNSVLLNYYRSGSDSMGWHRDNERELGPRPIIASISLGERRRFRMQHIKNKQRRWESELNHGSALIMAGSTQEFWRHSVPKSKTRNGPRINLTFRVIY